MLFGEEFRSCWPIFLDAGRRYRFHDFFFGGLSEQRNSREELTMPRKSFFVHICCPTEPAHSPSHCARVEIPALQSISHRRIVTADGATWVTFSGEAIWGVKIGRRVRARRQPRPGRRLRPPPPRADRALQRPRPRRPCARHHRGRELQGGAAADVGLLHKETGRAYHRRAGGPDRSGRGGPAGG
jgi:hypothetical protein